MSKSIYKPSFISVTLGGTVVASVMIGVKVADCKIVTNTRNVSSGIILIADCDLANCDIIIPGTRSSGPVIFNNCRINGCNIKPTTGTRGCVVIFSNGTIVEDSIVMKSVSKTDVLSVVIAGADAFVLEPCSHNHTSPVVIRRTKFGAVSMYTKTRASPDWWRYGRPNALSHKYVEAEVGILRNRNSAADHAFAIMAEGNGKNNAYGVAENVFCELPEIVGRQWVGMECLLDRCDFDHAEIEDDGFSIRECTGLGVETKTLIGKTEACAPLIFKIMATADVMPSYPSGIESVQTKVRMTTSINAASWSLADDLVWNQQYQRVWSRRYITPMEYQYNRISDANTAPYIILSDGHKEVSAYNGDDSMLSNYEKDGVKFNIYEPKSPGISLERFVKVTRVGRKTEVFSGDPAQTSLIMRAIIETAVRCQVSVQRKYMTPKGEGGGDKSS